MMIDDQLRAIAHPARRAILALTWSRELSAGEVADSFDMSRPAVSQHLRALVTAGLLFERRQQTRRLYRTDHTRLRKLRAKMDFFLATGLARLKKTIEHDLGRSQGARQRVKTARRKRK
jgi:DNA-binding transcriptional ArsR family regulator